MRIVINVWASYDTEANATGTSAVVCTYDSYIGDGSRKVVHSEAREVLWDDTHEIAVSTAMQKALSRWSERCDWQQFAF